MLNTQGDTLANLAEVLLLAGRPDEALTALEQAAFRYERRETGRRSTASVWRPESSPQSRPSLDRARRATIFGGRPRVRGGAMPDIEPNDDVKQYLEKTGMERGRSGENTIAALNSLSPEELNALDKVDRRSNRTATPPRRLPERSTSPSAKGRQS